jgi:sporadic carbohydrate cluster protein (TIGR04323 family)
MSKKREGYRGYVTCREFGGLTIPVPIQSMLLREYCEKHKLIYKLHLNENIFPHSYMVLEGIVENLSDFEGLLMGSMFMLPKKSGRRADIYRKVFDQKIGIHFVMEDIVIKSFDDVQMVEEVLSIGNLIDLCPKELDKAN